MKKILLILIILTMQVMPVGAEGLLNRNSAPTSLEEQELDDAYSRGYGDAKSGKGPRAYMTDGVRDDGQVVRGAGRGALGGAAIGGLADGDAGRGAAWGAGMGALKGAVKKRREAAEEEKWASDLSNAYNRGYNQGVMEKNAAEAAKQNVKNTSEK